MAKARISRRKLAEHTARKLMQGDHRQAMTELAAFLVQTNRLREAELIIRDIEYALYQDGNAVVDVTSAQKLSDALRKEVMALTKAESQAITTVHLREHVDPSILGGVRLEYGQQQLDLTVKHKLNKLKAGQI